MSEKSRIALGEKLKIAREKLKLTQAEVAKKAGWGANYYACVERGEKNPTFEKLEKICEVLGLELIIR